jgi:hypothetical protein
MAALPQGTREALKALAEISKSALSRGIATALLGGLDVYLPAVLEKAPENEGAYKAALEIRKPRRRRGTVIAGIGLNRDKLYTTTGGRRPSNLPALLEYGHALKHKNAEGRMVDLGTVAARPHFRPALEHHTDAALEAIRVALMQHIESVADRFEKRAASALKRARRAASKRDYTRASEYVRKRERLLEQAAAYRRGL